MNSNSISRKLDKYTQMDIQEFSLKCCVDIEDNPNSKCSLIHK